METLNANNLSWKSEYNIGNLKIDNEHKYLFQIAQKALNIMEKENSSNEDLKFLIKKLFEYVSTHFKNEEEYMKSVEYPELTRHKELHKTMINMLTKLIDDLNTMEHENIKKAIFSFIDEYFVKHIISEDKKIHLHTIPLEDLRDTFGWKDIYKIEEPIIDSEHQQLFEIASNAFNIVDSEHRNEKIKYILMDLYDYMKRHFEHEEEFMQKINYVKLEDHKKLHQNIIDTLNSFVKNINQMNIEVFEKELARIIDITLVQHIIQEDRKIMDWHNINK